METGRNGSDAASANGSKAAGNGHRRFKGFESRRVLVVGGAGYLGSVVVRALLDRGYDVRVMDALVYGDDGIRDLFPLRAFGVVQADLRNLESVVRATRGVDAIVHLGALVGDPACTIDEQLTVEINLDATRTIAAVARGLGVERFVFASTCSVYGASDELLHEDSPLAPVSLYGRTKMDSERVLLSLASEEFTPVILRFGTLYGASPRPRFDLVVNMLTARAATEGEITVYGGDQWRPFVHVADAAAAVIRCLEAQPRHVRGEIFNVGSDEQNHTLKEIAAMIASLVPGLRVIYEEKQETEANYRVSFEKVRTRLGFAPRHGLADGLDEIIRSIRQGMVADHADARYSNHRSLLSTVDTLRTARGRVAEAMS